MVSSWENAEKTMKCSMVSVQAAAAAGDVNTLPICRDAGRVYESGNPG